MPAAALSGHAHVIMQILCDNGDNINYDGQLEAASLFTLAACSGHVEVMQCLMRNRLCLDVDNCGTEALHEAMLENNNAVIDFLRGKVSLSTKSSTSNRHNLGSEDPILSELTPQP
jgi:hypothetical protein